MAFLFTEEELKEKTTEKKRFSTKRFVLRRVLQKILEIGGRFKQVRCIIHYYSKR